MKKNQILIVGGSSGLGLHLTNLYLKKKYKVTTISRNINTKIKKNVKQISCDVTDAKQMKKLLKNFKVDSFYVHKSIENLDNLKKENFSQLPPKS